MCLSFFGCFRAGELCLTDNDKFSPKTHLTFKDCVIDTSLRSVAITLKHSKTDSFSEGVIVKIGCSGTPICAFCLTSQYLATHPSPLANSPLLLDSNLTVLRKSYFVATTKLILAASGYDPSHYSGHSFRAGSATSGASAGFSAWELKMLGRWSSNAYQIYLRNSDLVTSFAHRLAGSDHE